MVNSMSSKSNAVPHRRSRRFRKPLFCARWCFAWRGQSRFRSVKMLEASSSDTDCIISGIPLMKSSTPLSTACKSSSVIWMTISTSLSCPKKFHDSTSLLRLEVSPVARWAFNSSFCPSDSSMPFSANLRAISSAKMLAYTPEVASSIALCKISTVQSPLEWLVQRRQHGYLAMLLNAMLPNNVHESNETQKPPPIFGGGEQRSNPLLCCGTSSPEDRRSGCGAVFCPRTHRAWASPPSARAKPCHYNYTWPCGRFQGVGFPWPQPTGYSWPLTPTSPTSDAPESVALTLELLGYEMAHQGRPVGRIC